MKIVNNKLKMTVLSVAMCVALGSVGMQIVQADNGASINLSSNSLSYAGSSGEDRLTLSIAGPSMEVVSVSATSSLYWDLPNNLADGTYRYELNVSTPSGDGVEENNSSDRMHGTFEVINGIIDMTPTLNTNDEGSDATVDGVGKVERSIFVKMAIAMLDFAIPTTQAADVVADSAANAARMYFRHNGVTKWQRFSFAGTGDNLDGLFLTGNSSHLSTVQRNTAFTVQQLVNEYKINTPTGDFNGTDPTFLSINKAANNSFIADASGDISLADGSVFINKSANRIGIGTTTPVHELDLVSTNPTIRLEDTDGQTWMINRDGGSATFDIANDTQNVSMFKIRSLAPVNSLVIANGGNIGMGLLSPLFDLHIKRDDANIFVQDTNGASPSGVLMELSKNGIPAFRLTNTATSTSWDFSQRDDKRLVMSLGGSGAFEFTIDELGNTVTRGTSKATLHINTSSREAKTDFESVNANEVMNKIKGMEVSEWRYKDTAAKGRHIGPVAEDFYSLFKLGADDKHIAASDIASIALIAAKELQKKSDAVDLETATLKSKTSKLELENKSLKARLASLEKLVNNLAAGNGLLLKDGNEIALQQ